MIGVRLQAALELKLRKRAREQGISITKLVAIALEDYLSISNNVDWSIMACNLFNVNIMQLQYALRNSKNVAEFILYIAGLGKRQIAVIPADDYIVKLTHADKHYTVKVSRDLPKEAACIYAVEGLHKALFAEFGENLPIVEPSSNKFETEAKNIIDKSDKSREDKI